MASFRTVLAPNGGPFTLDGTRTFLVGRDRVALVDPGPASDPHLQRLVEEVADASRVVILVTHDHSDHSAGAEDLSRLLDAPVRGALGEEPLLEDGDVVETDAGPLEVVSTPGHASPHLAFHWVRERAVFVGDLLLGEGRTTWVGAYPGCVADYLESLDRVEALGADVLYPAHGPPIFEVEATLERYRRHRMGRLAELRALRDAHPGTSAEELVELLYGTEVADPRKSAATRSVSAMLHHLETRG